MLASPFVAAVLKYWRVGLFGLLLLALAVQTVRVSHERKRADRILVNLNEARAELKAISEAKNRQKAETSKRIEQADKGNRDADRVAREIEEAPVAPNCETPPQVMGADL